MPFLVLLIVFGLIFITFAILAFIEAMRLLACGLVMLCLLVLIGA